MNMEMAAEMKDQKHDSTLPAMGAFKNGCKRCPKKKEILQRAAVNSGPDAVPPIVHEILRSPGQPLDKETREFMEPRFGHDFSQVRIHTDAKAAESARAVNARAYTVGENIVFGKAQYAPNRFEGKRLLAHELTHTIQQGISSSIQRSSIESLSIGHNNDTLEKMAEMQAARISQREPISNRITSQLNIGILQRESEEQVPPAPSLTAAPTPAATTAGTAEITLETGNIGAGFLNNLVHQQICVDRYGTDSGKRCFSFAATGAQLPQFSSTWLGWNSLVTGAILKGQIYEPDPVSGATIVSRHTPTEAQGSRWLNYMLSTRLGLEDAYSVARHNCRTFSQWEFRDAPSHW
jgi:hypothetical protein